LARYQIACCAADAVAADGVPELGAETLTAIPAPVDPYE